MMRKSAAAAALAALALAGPPPADAAGARAHAPVRANAPAHAQAPAGVLALRPRAQPTPLYLRHAPHPGIAHPRYPNADLMPGLVVHPAHRHVRRALVISPLAHGFIHYAPQYLHAPAFAIDGDTFDCGGVRYRLYGIDTPELGEPLGTQARVRLQQLLAMGPVTVIPVAVDAYGRHVAEVLVTGWTVPPVLRAEGFAKP